MAPTVPAKDALPSFEGTKHNIPQHIDLAVRIKVGRGTNSQEYDFHRGLLKFYSGYFRTAIRNIDDGRFVEAEKGVIELPDEEPTIFDTFKNWLYTHDRKLRGDQRIPDYQLFSYQELCELWLFAERRIIPMLQNRAIDLIISKMAWRTLMELTAVRYAYENSAPNSHLRRVLVFGNSLICRIDASEVVLEDEGKKPWFQEWSTDVSLERISQVGKNNLVGDRCSYHQHEPGVECHEKAWKTY